MASRQTGEMFYRSDWPEKGQSSPFSDQDSAVDSPCWQSAEDGKWRWISKQDDFESRLYDVPIWNLSLEIQDSGSGWLATGLNSPEFSNRLREVLRQYLRQAPWSHAYVAVKVVPDEPLYPVLTDAGFEQVDHRCLYWSNVSDLQMSQADPDDPIRYQTLATVAVDQRDRVRDQIVGICRETMQAGYSRHFTDSFLLQRAPGLSYILSVMKLNFERVSSQFILVAQDLKSGRTCGFSILGERPSSGQPLFTQLLSGVSNEYRGKGVYAGLTRLLTEVLPSDGQLVNITHAENHAMRRAYDQSGRRHLADTVVLRSIFGSKAS